MDLGEHLPVVMLDVVGIGIKQRLAQTYEHNQLP